MTSPHLTQFRIADCGLRIEDFDSPREISKRSSVTNDNPVISRGKLNPAENRTVFNLSEPEI
jgi:hypothetical protein